MSWIWSRGSRCGAITPVRSPLPHSPGREGTRCRRRAAWKEGNKEYRSDQIHCGGGARSGPRGVREITPPPLMATSWAMIRRYRGSLLGLKLSSYLLGYMCTFSIFGCCRRCCRICGAARVCVTHWRHAALRTQFTAEALQSFLVMRESQQWVRWAPERLKLP